MCRSRRQAQETREAYRKKVLGAWAWGDLRNVQILEYSPGSGAQPTDVDADNGFKVSASSRPSVHSQNSSDNARHSQAGLMMDGQRSISEPRHACHHWLLRIESHGDSPTEWPLVGNTEEIEVLNGICRDVTQVIMEFQTTY
jgi:hypothetical protein